MSELGERIQGLIEFPSKVEAAVSIFGKLCLGIAVFLALKSGETFEEKLATQMPNLTVEFSEENQATDTKANISEYNLILDRNIFGTKESETVEKTEVPKTKLNLRLVGASITQGESPFAIIEETKKNEQDVFELEESVFGQAKLIEISPQDVKLERNGSIEILLLEAGEGSSIAADSGIEASEDGSNYEITEEELNKELANLPRLLSQARAVPYFRNGASIGMRLFAIRKDSLYDKIGLKNGDILKDINGNSLSDPSQALKLFEILKNERSISVIIERAGEDKRLEYAIN